MESQEQSNEITDFIILEGLEIARAGQAKELILIADDVKLESDADVRVMIDYVSRISTILKEMEAERKGRQAPILAGITRDNARYKLITAPLSALKVKLEKMMGDYQAEQERKARADAEAIRKAAEEKALAEAKRLEDIRRATEETARIERERLEAEGKANEAKAVADKAAEDSKLMQAKTDQALQESLDAAAPDIAPIEAMRGNTGGSASLHGKWTWELEDIDNVPREHFILNEKRIGALVRSGEREIPGIRIFRETKMVVRK